MSERRFVISEVRAGWRGQEIDLVNFPITLSEFRRRIDLAFRTAFCTLDEKFDYAKAVEIIVNGEGEKGDESPSQWADRQWYGKPDANGPFGKPTPTREPVGKRGEECRYCKQGYPLEYHPGWGWYHSNPDGGPDLECKCPPHEYGKSISREQAIEISKQTLERAEEERKPSPAPTRAEWEKWCNKFSLMMFNYHVINWEGANELKSLLLSMPIVPKEIK